MTSTDGYVSDITKRISKLKDMNDTEYICEGLVLNARERDTKLITVKLRPGDFEPSTLEGKILEIVE